MRFPICYFQNRSVAAGFLCCENSLQDFHKGRAALTIAMFQQMQFSKVFENWQKKPLKHFFGL
jgi:hypothetical protein